ncbi:hypothetical protein HYY75_06810, partial [bacterium]|nr:hypothetical protein [bacterium]
MNFRTFTADSRLEAFLKAEKELGKDIRVVGEKKVNSSSYLGLYAKEMVEITVIVVPSALQKSARPVAPTRPTLSEDVTDHVKLTNFSGKTSSPQVLPATQSKLTKNYAPHPVSRPIPQPTSKLESNLGPSGKKGTSSPQVPYFPEDQVPDERIQSLIDLLKQQKKIQQDPAKSPFPNQVSHPSVS